MTLDLPNGNSDTNQAPDTIAPGFDKGVENRPQAEKQPSQNPPQEFPQQDQTPREIPEKA